MSDHTTDTLADDDTLLSESLSPDEVVLIDETGHIVPEPRWEELDVSAPVVAALEKRGMERAFAIQTLVLPDAMAGRDVLAKSRTGSGKTLAFAIPIVERLEHGPTGPRALILVPTRELATQVAEEFAGIAPSKKLKVATAYGGVGLADQAKKAKASDVLVATPGRLLDLYRRKMISLNEVSIAVLDEADRMLDMGFLPDVSTILGALPSSRQTMLFSATLDGEVGRLAQRYTEEPVLHEIIEARPVHADANHRFITVQPGEKLDAMVKLLEEDRSLTLVFVRTKRGADRLADSLQSRGFEARALHGDMTQPAREKTLAQFERGEINVLVATDVAARGLDLDDITHVINYDPPEDEKAYVHRVGRTARAGRSGTGITLVLPDQRGDVSRVAARLQLEDEIKEAGMKMMPPRTVYQGGRGKNRLLGKRPRRRF